MTCRGRTKGGEPCGAKPRPGTDLCPWHAPDLAERRAEWSARGGRQSSNRARARKHLPADLLTMGEVQAYLGVALKGVLAGKVEPGVGTAVANIARAMTQVAGASEFADDLADLRRQFVEIRGAS